MPVNLYVKTTLVASTIIGILFLIPSCATDAASPVPVRPDSTELLAQLPPLPISAEPRSASGSYEIMLRGHQAWALGPGAELVDETADLLAADIHMSWVMYGIWLGERSADNLLVELSISQGPIYIATSDYGKNSWEFSGPYYESGTQSIPVDEHNVSATSYIFLAVIAARDAGAVVHAVHTRINPVEGEWDKHIVDWEWGIGPFVSMFIQDGKPMVAYRNERDRSIWFARSTVARPQSVLDWVKMKVVGTGLPRPEFGAISAASIDGKPAILFVDHESESVLYAHAFAEEPDSMEDWRFYVLDSDAANVRNQTSLAEVNSLPVATYGFGNDALVATAVHPRPDADQWKPMEFEEDFGATSVPVIQEVAGRPALVYTGQDLAGTKFYFSRAVAEQPTGPVDWTCHVLDDSEDSGRFPAMAILPQKPKLYPMVAFFTGFAGYGPLRFAGTDHEVPLATADWSISSVDAVSQGFSLVTIESRPAIIYYQNTVDAIRLARADSPFPDSIADWQIENVVEVQPGYSESSAAVWADLLVVMFRDSTSRDLRCATRQF